MEATRKTNPEMFCAYQHCGALLSVDQLAVNDLIAQGAWHSTPAKYCCRRHKELATQQRRRAARKDEVTA